jgi:hypothetical protein
MTRISIQPQHLPGISPIIRVLAFFRLRLDRRIRSVSVTLDLVHRADGGGFRVFSDRAQSIALAQEIPALVQGFLNLPEPPVFLGGGDGPGLQLFPQVTFGVNQFGDLLVDAACLLVAQRNSGCDSAARPPGGRNGHRQPTTGEIGTYNPYASSSRSQTSLIVG